MRGVVFTGGRELELMNFADPTPGPDEVVIEMKASGMCGSDLHQYRRPKSGGETGGLAAPSEPTIAGHEPCGIVAAVGTAVEVAGSGLGAVRIDSGDLALYARQVREQLDSLGARHTRIVLTGDLDEHSIAALAVAPGDGYGVGTSLVTGSGAPTAALVYKMVARAEDDGDGPLRPVAKRSVGKPSKGGRKWAAREFCPDGSAVGVGMAGNGVCGRAT